MGLRAFERANVYEVNDGVNDEYGRILTTFDPEKLRIRSAETVHTFAKAHLRIAAIPIRFRIRVPDPDRHQNLIISLLPSVAHCQPSLKISCKSVRKLLRKVANRQTNQQ